MKNAASASVRKKILVTGASGLIGRAVMQNLLAINRYEIKAQVRNAAHARAEVGSPVDFTKVQLEECDFTLAGEREMRRLAAGCQIIIHAAGLVHKPDASYQEYDVLNVRTTQALAQAAADNNVETFVFLSSSSVYGAGPFENVTETAPLSGVTPYAISKITAERFLENFPTIARIIILRPSLVFGEGDKGNLLSLMRSIQANQYKHIDDGRAYKSVIYSKDVAGAIALCLDVLPPGYHVFNVANQRSVSMKNLAEEIALCLGVSDKIPSLPSKLVKMGIKAASLLMPGKIPITEDQLDKLITTTTCSTNRISSATGFQPGTALKTALRAEIDWARARNLL